MSSPDPEDEGRLVEEAQKGSESAFEELRRRHRKEVRGYIRARVSPADVDDLEQDVWFEARVRLHQYDSARGPFVAFVKNIAHWRIVEYYKNQYRDREHNSASIDDSEPSQNPPPMKANTPSPFAATASHEHMERFLEVTFSSSLPPHQLIVFGFVKLLEWRPREIVAELSDHSLRDLENRLENDYLEVVNMREQIVRRSFRPLQERLDLRVERAITDPSTLCVYQRLIGLVAGETILLDYYTDEDREKNVAHWCYSVGRRVLPQFLVESLPNRRKNR